MFSKEGNLQLISVNTSEITSVITKIPTTIKIDPDLLKQAKHYAIDSNITFSELLERALMREIGS